MHSLAQSLSQAMHMRILQTCHPERAVLHNLCMSTCCWSRETWSVSVSVAMWPQAFTDLGQLRMVVQ